MMAVRGREKLPRGQVSEGTVAVAEDGKPAPDCRRAEAMGREADDTPERATPLPEINFVSDDLFPNEAWI